ncbi:alpha-methylacyl-CoA racemase [Rhizobiales bacterium GAS191]|nr:alpha-methylacyl-CoA racemase [Rhizobiales bacterium GAS191]
MAGPLSGVKVVHLASLGPGPYCAMLLADMGCEVVIVDRTQPMTVSVEQGQDPRRRGQKSIALDLKRPEGLAALLDLVRWADVFIEGMRPGATERLGVGPAACLAINPGLVYARVTGWGQDGPLAERAGHDINYIALSGALLAMGEPGEPPPVPLNLLGDYAGGGVFVAMGIAAALYERERSGKGQVIDGAIADGVGSLTAATMGMLAAGRWGARGTNPFDGSAPWYRTYATHDGGFVAVGAIEPQFYRMLLKGLGLDPDRWNRDDPRNWPDMIETFTGLFDAKDRDHWEHVFGATDACVSPVLTFEEATRHPHHAARASYVEIAGVAQPVPAPRFSRSVAAHLELPPPIGRDTDAVLSSIGRSDEEIVAMRASGAAA